MRTLVLRTAFAATLSLAALGWAQTSLQQQMQRMLAGSAPFALQLSGPHTTMPVISERNLFLYTALSSLDAMSIDCAAISQSFPTWDEVFCAGFVGKAPQLADEWRDPQPTSAFSLLPWDKSDPAMATATYIVENGMLIVMAISLPNEDASAVLGMWMECEGRIGSNPDVSRWSDSEKASLAACLERVELGATVPSVPSAPSAPPPPGPTTDAPAGCSGATSGWWVEVVGPSEAELCVNVAVLRVRDAPGLQANVVGRAELGTLGRLVSVEHRDVDGFRWWHVRFADELQGWVADGDAELDYLVRVPRYGSGGGRLTPFAPLPDLAPLAAALFREAGVTPAECSEWQTERAPVSTCARATETVRGPWGAAAEAVRDAVDPLLQAAGLSPRVPWQDDGGSSMVSLHSEWVDETQVVLVVIGIGPDEEPMEVVLLQWYP
jgi:hypothetical protein